MKALVVCLVVGLGVGVLAVACDGGGRTHHAKGHRHVDCRAQTTCGACTPIVGCGWCASGDGTGTCVDGPDDCADASSSFDWDPSGCADAGEPIADGGHVVADAQIGDGGPSIADAADAD